MAQITELSARGSEVLDASRLAAYRKMRPGFLERLVAVYLQEAPTYLSTLKLGVAASEFETIRLAAHTLKSSSANLGAMRLAEICQKIESAAVSKNIDDVTALAASVGSEFFAAEQALKSAIVEQRKAAI